MKCDRQSWSLMPANGQQAGVTLIEVLVAILIMGISLLGIAAMQATALRNSQSSLEQGQAVAYSYSIIDAMRANRAAALTDGYDTNGMVCAVAASTGSRSERDISMWIGSLKRSFSSTPDDDETTCGQISCEGPQCTITIQWDDQRASGPAGGGVVVDTGAGGRLRQVSTVVRI